MTAPVRFGGEDRPEMDHIPFEIAVWQRGVDGEPLRQEPEYYLFHAYGSLPGGALFDLASYTDAQGRTAGAAMLEFFRRCIVDDELADWERVIHDPVNIVLAADLNNLAKWLNDEHYLPPMRRPSRRERRASPGGRSSTGATQTAELRDPAWTST